MTEVKFSQAVLDTAAKIVDNCMGMEDSPCVSTCPMSTDVKEYVHLIAEGRYEDSLKVIREKLFLPATLGRICAHPCEKNCRREAEFGQPLSIAALKRFAAEKADHEGLWDVSRKESTGKRVAVVGAGPAGAQAAIDLAKCGHEVTILERLEVPGGMMRVGIPEYRLPRQVIEGEYRYLDRLGVRIQYGVEVGKTVSLADLESDYDAVVLAHGAHKGSIVPVPGHNGEGVFSAAEYLKEISLTKAFPRAGKRVCVIGGGDVAMDCARSSWRIGADEVFQCSLEDDDTLPASAEEIREAKEEGVLFNAGWGPKEIFLDGGKVVGIRLQKVLSVFDEEGRFNPSYGEDTKDLEVDTVVFATGQLVEDVTEGALEQTRGGRYVVDGNTLATSREKVFIAGDAAGTNIVVEAMAYGRKAALSVDRFLSGRDLLADRELKKEFRYETKLDIPLPEGTEDLPRLSPNLREPEVRKRDFEQCDAGFTEEQAVAEAGRCLQCECKLCMKECVMMNDFGTCPKEILERLKEKGEMDPLLAYSCNACDNCTIVCPHEFSLKQVFVGSRKDFVAANGGESPMAGHKAIKMHQLLGFSKFFTTKIRGGKN